MRRIVLTGPPGAGKGTQSSLLAARWGVPHIASGDILRRIIATEDSDLARSARVINEGKMIPDAVANAIVFRELDKPEAAPGFILDGYPRDVAQAGALAEYLDEKGCALDAAVALRIDREALVERLTGRLTCPQCGESYHVRAAPPKAAGVCDLCGHALVVREDDQPDRIRTRFEVYAEQTEPLLDWYRGRGLLRTVDGSGTEHEVLDRILRVLS